VTDKQRRDAAWKFRKLLDSGVLRKIAILKMRDMFGISRTSIYEYCKKFGVPTN
jgi:predicted transcriptional regulator YheO